MSSRVGVSKGAQKAAEGKGEETCFLMAVSG